MQSLLPVRTLLVKVTNKKSQKKKLRNSYMMQMKTAQQTNQSIIIYKDLKKRSMSFFGLIKRKKKIRVLIA